MDIDLFFKYIFPSLAVSVGAYIAIRVDLARMTEKLIHISEKVKDAKDAADHAHDRINSMRDK